MLNLISEDDPKVAFAALRSLMNTTKWTKVHQQQYIDLMAWCHEQHSTLHAEQWVPYTLGFPQHFETILLNVSSFRILDRFAAICPQALLTLKIDDSSNRVKEDLVARLGDPTRRHAIKRLRTLHLRGCELSNKHATQLSMLPGLDSIHTLKLERQAQLTMTGIQDLFTPTCFSALRDLTFSVSSLHNEDARYIARIPLQLRRLNLQRNGFNARGVGFLANAQEREHLQSLTLAYNPIGDEGARALARSKHVTLESLNVRACGLTPDGARIIGQSDMFSTLKTLEIGSNNLGPEGMRRLFESSVLTALKELALHHNDLEDEGIIALTQEATHTQLTSINLEHNSVGPRGIERLANTECMASLNTLNLSHNPVRDEGARALAKSTSLNTLTSLQVRASGIGPKGGVAIANARHFSSLKRLDLHDNAIGDEGAIALAQASHLNGLLHLDLAGNRIGPRGAMAIANAPHLKSLLTLNIQLNRIEAEGAHALANSPYLHDSITSQFLFRS